MYSGESLYDRRDKIESSSDMDEAKVGTCERCGYMSNNVLCQACSLLDRLNRGLPRFALFDVAQQSINDRK